MHVGDTIIGIKGRVGFEAAAPMLIIGAHRFHFLDGFDRVVKLLVVDSFQFPFFESQAELFAAFFFNMFELGCFRESLCGVEDFATTDRSTP